ncbi:hypothetical protein J3F83DRAFT_481195 [Trichoderma novae-zelandiae]
MLRSHLQPLCFASLTNARQTHLCVTRIAADGLLGSLFDTPISNSSGEGGQDASSRHTNILGSSHAFRRQTSRSSSTPRGPSFASCAHCLVPR